MYNDSRTSNRTHHRLLSRDSHRRAQQLDFHSGQCAFASRRLDPLLDLSSSFCRHVFQLEKETEREPLRLNVNSRFVCLDTACSAINVTSILNENDIENVDQNFKEIEN